MRPDIRAIRLAAVLLLLGMATVLTACKDRPAADGRYATNDRGNFRP
jgi:hypothetical protein